MKLSISIDSRRRTLVRACVGGLLMAMVAVSACTTSQPPVPDGTDNSNSTPTPAQAAADPTPAQATADPRPTAHPLPSASLAPLPTEPDGLGPSGDPYSYGSPTSTPASAGPLPSGDPVATPTGSSPSDPPPASNPTTGLVPWTGTPGKPATRIVIRELRIDLPVVRGDHRYPLCNVAQYMTSFVNPGMVGSTYLYGHARRGMLLPILDASKRNNGAAMLGMRVDVYTSDNARFVYEIFKVKRHVNDLSLAYDLKRNEHRLVVQTSEGPSGAYPKLQIAARPIGVYEATSAEAKPVARPRSC